MKLDGLSGGTPSSREMKSSPEKDEGNTERAWFTVVRAVSWGESVGICRQKLKVERKYEAESPEPVEKPQLSSWESRGSHRTLRAL